MTNNEIFEMLANAESELFYKSNADRDNAELKAAHIAAKQALEQFAKATGCHN